MKKTDVKKALDSSRNKDFLKAQNKQLVKWKVGEITEGDYYERIRVLYDLFSGSLKGIPRELIDAYIDDTHEHEKSYYDKMLSVIIDAGNGRKTQKLERKLKAGEISEDEYYNRLKYLKSDAENFRNCGEILIKYVCKTLHKDEQGFFSHICGEVRFSIYRCKNQFCPICARDKAFKDFTIMYDVVDEFNKTDKSKEGLKEGYHWINENLTMRRTDDFECDYKNFICARKRYKNQTLGRIKNINGKRELVFPYATEVYRIEVGDNLNVHSHSLIFAPYWLKSFQKLDPERYYFWKYGIDKNIRYVEDNGHREYFYTSEIDVYGKKIYRCVICKKISRYPEKKCKYCNSKTKRMVLMDVSSKDFEGKKIKHSHNLYMHDLHDNKGELDSGKLTKSIRDILKYCLKMNDTKTLSDLKKIYKAFKGKRSMGVNGLLYGSKLFEDAKKKWNKKRELDMCVCCKNEKNNFKVEKFVTPEFVAEYYPEHYLKIESGLKIDDAKAELLNNIAKKILESFREFNGARAPP